MSSLPIELPRKVYFLIVSTSPEWKSDQGIKCTYLFDPKRTAENAPPVSNDDSNTSIFLKSLKLT